MIQEYALSRTDLGFVLSFGDPAEFSDEFRSSSVKDRLADLHEAFADPDVDGILTAIGGFNTNQLLDSVDYELVRTYPKVLCGISDITALANALLARAGLVTYSGPHYSSIGMEQHFEHTEKGFLSCLLSDAPMELEPSSMWSDDMLFVYRNPASLMTQMRDAGFAVQTEEVVQGSRRWLNVLAFGLITRPADAEMDRPDLSPKVRWNRDLALCSPPSRPGGA